MMGVTGKTLYEQLSDLLEYPREDIKLRVEECIKALSAYPQYPPEAVGELMAFLEKLGEITLDDLQGIYSYTFELTSEYTLDLGHFLFDGFKRSNYLAMLKGVYREQGFPFEKAARGELPDHLPVVLRFLAFTKDDEVRKEIRESFLVISMEKLNKNFERNRANPYSHIINAIYRIIDKDVKEAK